MKNWGDWLPHVPPDNHLWTHITTKTERERDTKCRMWEFHATGTLPDGSTLPVYVTITHALLKEIAG